MFTNENLKSSKMIVTEENALDYAESIIKTHEERRGSVLEEWFRIACKALLESLFLYFAERKETTSLNKIKDMVEKEFETNANTGLTELVMMMKAHKEEYKQSKCISRFATFMMLDPVKARKSVALEVIYMIESIS
jgi:hypothetical protein